MRAQDAVITEPVRTPPIQRGAFAVLTVLAWTLFGWLVLPALTLALWFAGLMTAYEEAVQRLRQIDGELLAGVAAGAVVASVLLVLWAETQRRRFSGADRRRRMPDIRPEIVALDLGASPAVARTLQSSRVVVLALDDDGAPIAARSADLPRQRLSGPDDGTLTVGAASPSAQDAAHLGRLRP